MKRKHLEAERSPEVKHRKESALNRFRGSKQVRAHAFKRGCFCIRCQLILARKRDEQQRAEQVARVAARLTGGTTYSIPWYDTKRNEEAELTFKWLYPVPIPPCPDTAAFPLMWLNPRQAAAVLGVSRRTVYYWRTRGCIPWKRSLGAGGGMLVNVKAVQRPRPRTRDERGRWC